MGNLGGPVNRLEPEDRDQWRRLGFYPKRRSGGPHLSRIGTWSGSPSGTSRSDKRARIRPFIPNGFQRYYLEQKAEALARGRPPRFLVQKSRRGGITTWEQAHNYFLATQPNQRVVTLAHDLDSTIEIFDTARGFWRYGFGDAKPLAGQSNRRELLFHNGSSKFFVGTAGGEGFGRGFTLSRVHGSEVAKWPGKLKVQEDLLAGLTEACSHGEVVLESTANGASGLFYELCEEARVGEGVWTLIFLPWWLDDDCRLPILPKEVERLEATLTEKELFLIDRHGLEPDQIKWRRAKKLELKRLFPQEYPESATEAFLRSGHCFFDVDRILALSPRCKEPVRVLQGGKLHIWVEPEKGRRYIIGADSSEGLPGRDPSAACVLDFETGAQVARLWGYWRPHEFGRLIVKLAKAYNWAHIVPEVNNHGHSTLNTILVQEGYPSNAVYHRKKFDDGTSRPVKVAGWDTTAKTRPLLLDAVAEMIDSEGFEVNDAEFLAECHTFNLQENGKYEADDGKHDDLVIAWALAYYVRKTERPYHHPPKVKAEKVEVAA